MGGTLTMNPDHPWSGSARLPLWVTIVSVDATVSPEVGRPATTSTTFITRAGSKNSTPSTCVGRFV
jgi:hypothetical protein